MFREAVFNCGHIDCYFRISNFKTPSLKTISSNKSSSVHGVFHRSITINSIRYEVNLREISDFTESEICDCTSWSDAVIIIYSELDKSSLR